MEITVNTKDMMEKKIQAAETKQCHILLTKPLSKEPQIPGW